jgi:hypothetical protein
VAPKASGSSSASARTAGAATGAISVSCPSVYPGQSHPARCQSQQRCWGLTAMRPHPRFGSLHMPATHARDGRPVLQPAPGGCRHPLALRCCVNSPCHCTAHACPSTHLSGTYRIYVGLDTQHSRCNLLTVLMCSLPTADSLSSGRPRSSSAGMRPVTWTSRDRPPRRTTAGMHFTQRCFAPVMRSANT